MAIHTYNTVDTIHTNTVTVVRITYKSRDSISITTQRQLRSILVLFVLRRKLSSATQKLVFSVHKYLSHMRVLWRRWPLTVLYQYIVQPLPTSRQRRDFYTTLRHMKIPRRRAERDLSLVVLCRGGNLVTLLRSDATHSTVAVSPHLYTTTTTNNNNTYTCNSISFDCNNLLYIYL